MVLKMAALEDVDTHRKEKARAIYMDAASNSADLGASSSVQGGTNVTNWRYKCQLLEKLMFKEVSKWWEMTTLSQYVKVNRVPRGLCIFTIPTYETPYPGLLEEWAEYMANTSRA